MDEDEGEKCPECPHPTAWHLKGFGCTAGCVCQIEPKEET